MRVLSLTSKFYFYLTKFGVYLKFWSMEIYRSICFQVTTDRVQGYGACIAGFAYQPAALIQKLDPRNRRKTFISAKPVDK